MYIFLYKNIYIYICIEKQFIAEYIIKCPILFIRVYIFIEKYTAGCHRLFAGDNQLSADLA